MQMEKLYYMMEEQEKPFDNRVTVGIYVYLKTCSFG